MAQITEKISQFYKNAPLKRCIFFILQIKKGDNELKGDLSLLIELQECDSKLVALLTSKKNLPEKMGQLDKDFLNFKDNIEQNKRKYEDLKNIHNGKEKEIQNINDNIAKAKQRLLEVKNNKEYQAILKEIDVAETSCSDIETKIISLLDEMDSLDLLVKKDEEILNQEKQKYEAERKKMEVEINSIDTDFSVCEQKRNDLRKKIESGLLTKYDKIKNRNNGVGVVSVWKAVCNGCHMNIPPQLYNELQKSSQLLVCPNCNRIIYYQNKENHSE